MKITGKLRGAWKSWTIWLNSICIAVLSGLPAVADAIPQMQPFLPEDWYRIIGGVIVGANILLRFKTNKSLDEK